MNPVAQASVAWGDVDNDGDLDLVVQGHDGNQAIATLYRNDPPGTLSPNGSTSLRGLYYGSVDWADCDCDGDIDLMATGHDGTNRRTVFYRNDPVGTLTADGDHGLPGVAMSDVAWGDFDADGDLDLAFSGEDVSVNYYARVYSNDGSGNLTLAASLNGVYKSSCAWGDYDNDGDLGIAVCGYDDYAADHHRRIYKNIGGSFGNQGYTLAEVCNGSLIWADVENDGDLDFFVTGQDFSTTYSRLYKNTGGVTNSVPTSPLILSSEGTEGDKLHLSWSGSTDTETRASGLNYCLRVGTVPDQGDVMSGCYGTPLMGNVGQATEFILDVPNGDYEWSVRAIDSGFMTSGWSSATASGDHSTAQRTIHPIDDVFVVNTYPSTCFGVTSEMNLHVGCYDVDGIARTYLKFPLNGFPPDDLLYAELVLYCLSMGSQPYYIEVWLGSHDGWDEETITWSNAPPPSAPQADGREVIDDVEFVRWNVTGYVQTQAIMDGMITEVLCNGIPAEGTPNYYAEFWSDEAPVSGYRRPHLLIVYRLPTSDAGDDDEEQLDPSVRLLDSRQIAGTHALIWDGRDDAGHIAASGVYISRLEAEGIRESRKLLLTK